MIKLNSFITLPYYVCMFVLTLTCVYTKNGEYMQLHRQQRKIEK